MDSDQIVWSLQTRFQAPLSTKADFLSDLAGLAYLDIFLSQVPNPEGIWNKDLMKKISLHRRDLKSNLPRVFSGMDASELNALIDSSKQCRDRIIFDIFLREGASRQTLDLLRWVLSCRDSRYSMDGVVCPIFLITPFIEIYASPVKAPVGAVADTDDSILPFTRWLMQAIIPYAASAVTPEGIAPMATVFLTDVIANIRIPVDVLFQSTRTQPMPFTTFVTNTLRDRVLFADGDGPSYRMKEFLKTVMIGPATDLFVSGVSTFGRILNSTADALSTALNRRVTVRHLFSDIDVFNSSMFNEKLYDPRGTVADGAASCYGIGIEAAADDTEDDTGSTDQNTTATNASTTSTSNDAGGDASGGDDGSGTGGDQGGSDDTSADTSTTQDTTMPDTPPSDGSGEPGDPATAPTDTDPDGAGSTEPEGAPALQENTMDLISFDKSSESANDIIYRDAVLALCVRIEQDGSFPVTATVRDQLTMFTKQYLYLVSIDCVKEAIKDLGLEDYLQSVTHKEG